jgi:lysozyme
VDLAVTDDDRLRLRAQLQADEGLRLFPYPDTAGNVSIGYGRNLTHVGISADEATTLFEHDLGRTELAVAEHWPWAVTLEPARYAVLVNMAYNLGVGGLATFTRMLAAVQAGDFVEAAREMRASAWDTQVGARAARLARQMALGTWA